MSALLLLLGLTAVLPPGSSPGRRSLFRPVPSSGSRSIIPLLVLVIAAFGCGSEPTAASGAPLGVIAEDAGFSALDAGAFGPWSCGLFDDCLTRCAGGAVPATPSDDRQSGDDPSAMSAPYPKACACEFGTIDLTVGCEIDSDCAMVAADLASCAGGGSSAAVLRANADAWGLAMSSEPVSVNPPTSKNVGFIWDLCGNSRAVCRSGRCLVEWAP